MRKLRQGMDSLLKTSRLMCSVLRLQQVREALILKMMTLVMLVISVRTIMMIIMIMLLLMMMLIRMIMIMVKLLVLILMVMIMIMIMMNDDGDGDICMFEQFNRWVGERVIGKLYLKSNQEISRFS